MTKSSINTLPPLRLLRRPDVSSLVGLAKSSLYDAIADGLMPPPVRLGSKTVAWPEHEVKLVIAAKIAGTARDGLRALVKRLVLSRSELAAAA